MPDLWFNLFVLAAATCILCVGMALYDVVAWIWGMW